MKKDPESKGKRDPDGLRAKNKNRPPASSSAGKAAGKKHKKLSDSQLAKVLEKINEGFVALDGQMNYLFVNQRGSELLQRQPEDLIGKNYWEEHPGDKDTSFGKAYVQAIESQTPIVLEDYYAPQNKWFENRIYPSRDGLSIFFNDITERKRAEDKLRESEQHMRLASQAARMCTWEMNIQDQSYQLGNNFAEIVGFSADILPKNSNEVSDLINVPEDLPAIRETLIRAVTTGSEIPPLQYRVVNPETKEIVWVEVNAKLVYHPAGKPHRMFGMLQNITGRKHKEEQLRAQEAELEEILNGTPFMLTRCSRDLRYRFVSRAYAEMIGRTPEDVVGQPIVEIIGEAGLKTMLPYIEQVLQGNRVEYETEVSFEGIDAPSLHVIYTPDYDEHGDVVGWFASIMDVTERRHARELLRGERALFKRIFDRAPILLSIYDPTTQSMRLNAQFEQLIGWKSEEVTVLSLLEACYPDPEYRQEVVQQLAASKENEWVDVKVQTRNGQALDTMWSNLSFPNGLQVGLGVDITERKRSEEALRQAHERAEAAADRITRLQQITGTLTRVASITQLAEALLEQGTQAVGAAAGILVGLLDNGQEIKTIAAFGYPAAAVRTEPTPLSAPTPISDCIRTKQAVWIRSHPEFAELYPALGKFRGTLGNQATLALPLMAGDRVLGALAFSFIEQREFDEDDQEFFLAVAQQCAQGLERARAEETLRHSEERFSKAFHASPVLKMIIRADTGQIVDINESNGHAFEYTRAEAIGKVVTDIIQVAEEQSQLALVPQMQVKDHIQDQEITVRTQSGTLRTVIFNSEPIVLHGEMHSLHTMMDITERKQIEQALRHSEARERLRAAQLEAIMEAVPAVIWIAHDSESRVVTGNRASYEILQIPSGRNASLSAPEGVHPTNFEVLHEGRVMQPKELPVQRAARGEEVYDFEEEVRFKDGTSIHLFGNAITLRDTENNPSGALAAFVDITARKKAEQALQQLNLELEDRVHRRTAELRTLNERLLEEIEERTTVEEALRESEATTRLILDTSPDVVVIANKQGRIMRVNAQIEKLFGYQPSDVIGKQIETLIPKRFHERYVEHSSSYIVQPYRRPMGLGRELSGRRKDGTEFPVDVMLTPIQNIADWDTMVTIHDSTDRRQMEEALRESHRRLQNLSQRLVEVQEEERRAIARELHDRVGQSLAALNLNLTIINNQLVNQVSEQIRVQLDDSMQLVAEVIALVRDVMANLRPTELDDYGLEVALQSHVGDFKSRYGIQVDFEKSNSPIPRLGPSIEMTLLRITQEALLNVVRHARADQATVSLQLAEKEVHLSVQDNGIGIASFSEANRPGSHGMTIMRERAEAVSGNLKVSSTPGKGTQVEVSIPIQFRA